MRVSGILVLVAACAPVPNQIVIEIEPPGADVPELHEVKVVAGHYVDSGGGSGSQTEMFVFAGTPAPPPIDARWVQRDQLVVFHDDEIKDRMVVAFERSDTTANLDALV